MRFLFEIDTKDYDPNGVAFVRNSARCIYIRGKRVAMIHNLKYDFYEFPGGGVQTGETRERAMIRETLEEAGLAVIPESVREYGYVHRVQKNQYGDADYFVQDNYYYLCDVEEQVRAQNLDAYEAEEQYTLEYVEPRTAISVNRNGSHGSANRNVIEREARVLELLEAEGYFR